MISSFPTKYHSEVVFECENEEDFIYKDNDIIIKHKADQGNFYQIEYNGKNYTVDASDIPEKK